MFLGGIKIRYLMFWSMSFVYLLAWSLSLRKTLWVELLLIDILKRKRLLKPKQRRRSFLIVNLPFKNGSLRLITWVERRALFLLQEGNPMEETQPLKDEQLFHYQKKAAVCKGVTIKDKQIATACSDAAGKDSSSSCSEMKNYDSGSNLKGLHNEGKFSFAKFNSSRLNSQLSPHHLKNHHCFDFIILLLLSGYSFSQVF